MAVGDVNFILKIMIKAQVVNLNCNMETTKKTKSSLLPVIGNSSVSYFAHMSFETENE